MMKIELNGIGKRYNKEWIFKEIDLTFHNDIYAILGGNGSGKSTLLQLIIGYLFPSEGKVIYSYNSLLLEQERVFLHSSLVAPYLELPEELSLKELYVFYSALKPMETNSSADFADRIQLTKHLNKPIKYFSSGMKQRVKLGLALFSKTSLCCLDEPLTNLDHHGYLWYRGLLDQNSNNRTIIICSNQEKEFELSRINIDISKYKHSI